MIDQLTLAKTDAWLQEHQVDDIEIMVPDAAGIPRGKAMPRSKFLSGMQDNGLRLPDAIFGMSVTGGYALSEVLTESEKDMILEPDLNTLSLVPWQPEPTAAVICDAVYQDGSPVDISSRQVLKGIIQRYKEKGWQPIVAPEFEFYLIARQKEGATLPSKPPLGRSGKRDYGNESYSIDGVDEFGKLFNEIYDYCDIQNIQVDTLIHEAGPGQFEFNVNHGDPLAVADQSFYFKRLVRQSAVNHGVHACFMAQPYSDDFGSAMHIHQSVLDAETGANIFATDDGEDTELFLGHIAGLQKYMAAVMPMLAPYVNSYRRFSSFLSAPTNTHWGRENRTVGLRVPFGDRNARRIENRVAGSDVNPYLAIAASLACGYLGMVEDLSPSKPVKGSAFTQTTRTLPQHFLQGVEKLEKSNPIIEILGENFVKTFVEIKKLEYADYSNVLSPWETQYLMLNI